jgi:Fic family protein
MTTQATQATSLSTLEKILLQQTETLNKQLQLFESNIKKLSKEEFNNEMERLAIDLSWKSSQIEGNTYSLLETEMLLKDKQTASGKTKDEAVMLLNHKAALDFIITQPDYISPLTISSIEDIHIGSMQPGEVIEFNENDFFRLLKLNA